MTAKERKARARKAAAARVGEAGFESLSEFMSDLQKARELEKLRNQQLLNRLLDEERQRIAQINAEMANRRAHQPGAGTLEIWKVRSERIQRTVDGRIEIRKDLAVLFPELASEDELNSLLAEINRSIDAHGGALRQPRPDVDARYRPAVARHLEQETLRIKGRAKTEIEIFKREFALNLHDKTAPAGVSVTTDGPVVVNLGSIFGNVQQVIGNVSEGGHRELAELLQQLAKAINDADVLGDERAAYLEQVQFISEQAETPTESRKTSMVKGVLAGMCGIFTLQHAANIAQILSVAGPVIANHFGIPWPL